MDFTSFQNEVLRSIPGSMIYTVELRPLWKAGLSPEAAVQKARNDGLVHKRGSASAPLPVTYSRGRLRLAGVRRKPTWELNYIQAKVKAAVFAIMVEAETHRLEPDALDYVRTTKKKLCE